MVIFLVLVFKTMFLPVANVSKNIRLFLQSNFSCSRDREPADLPGAWQIRYGEQLDLGVGRALGDDSRSAAEPV